MFKLVVLSVCVALAIAKPSGTLHGIPTIPSGISHQEIISNPVISTYAAGPVFSALPAATSYSYSNKIESAPAIHAVATAPVITKAIATPAVTKFSTLPAATSYSFQSRIDSAPITAEIHGNPVITKIATAPVITKAATLPATTSYTVQSGIVTETPLLAKVAAAPEANIKLAAPVVAKTATVETKFANLPAHLNTRFVDVPINYASAFHPEVYSYIGPGFTTRFANLELAASPAWATRKLSIPSHIETSEIRAQQW